MSLLNLPNDILVLIVQKIAKHSSLDMRLFLAAGTHDRDLVYYNDVLHIADIGPLCYDPTYIFKNRPGRVFFKRCLHAHNEEAIYYESLRLVTKESDIKGAISLLQQNVPHHADAMLAIAILSVCDGQDQLALAHFQTLFSTFVPFGSHDLRIMLNTLIHEVMASRPLMLVRLHIHSHTR